MFFLITQYWIIKLILPNNRAVDLDAMINYLLQENNKHNIYIYIKCLLLAKTAIT